MNPLNSLQGRVALVTGSTAGIGKATALGLARLNAHVIIVGRSRGAETMAELQAITGNPHVEWIQVDLSSFQSIDQLVTKVHTDVGRLDILIILACCLKHARNQLME